jgi:hypothetical protein
MDLSQAIRELRDRNEPVPLPLRVPTVEEVNAAEIRLGIRFHPDFRRYLLEASDVAYGCFEPVTITRADAHHDLLKVAENAWQRWGVPRTLVPICEDNADFYCMNAEGEVLFWSHNGLSSERWPSLAEWISNVWIAEAEQ